MLLTPKLRQIAILLLVSLCASKSSSAMPQESTDNVISPGSGLPLSSKDPDDARLRSTAEFAGVTIKSRMTQRFEMYCPHSEEDLKSLKSMGFTQVILDRTELHEPATRAGLKVVLGNWWSQDAKPEDIERGIAAARRVNPETLIGFSLMDEPDRNTPDTHFNFYIDLYERLKPEFRTEFPSTRIEISHWGPMATLTDAQFEYYSLLYKAADVMRIMPYPDLHEAPLDDVYYIIQRSRKVMKLADRELPLVVILQTWILPPKNELPKIDELRVMTYQAMLSGAETLSFFDFNAEVWNQTAGFPEQFRALMRELTDLSERYRDHLIETTITGDGILKSTLTSPAGHITRIEVNTQRHAVAGFEPLEVKEFTGPVTHPYPQLIAAGPSSAVAMTDNRNCCEALEVKPLPVSCDARRLQQVHCDRHARLKHDSGFAVRRHAEMSLRQLRRALHR